MELMNYFAKSLAALSLIMITSIGTVPALASANSSSPLSNPTFALESKEDACAGLTALDSTQDCNSSSNADDTISSIVGTVVDILSLLVGGIAVIMIIVSAVRFTTSGGDSNRVGSAKNGLIYALIGLAIATLAQFLIHFVIFQSNSIIDGTNSSTTSHSSKKKN